MPFFCLVGRLLEAYHESPSLVLLTASSVDIPIVDKILSSLSLQDEDEAHAALYLIANVSTEMFQL
jgi:hypothetical protein